MGNDNTHDDRDTFNNARWGAAPDADESGADGHASGHAAEQVDHYGDGFLRPALADVDEEATTGQGGAGHWVTQGGVLRWQADTSDDDAEGTEVPLREEALSSWAADDVDLPLGAPPTARLRAVRAWLARRRLRETELIGALLLERRRLASSSDTDESAEDALETLASPPANPHDPLALALAEAQAAADEYETLLGLLEETRAHVGPQAALVEYYLALTDRLATLASQPAAPESFAATTLFAEIERQPSTVELTPALRSEWEGRASAALAARKRVEQVTAAEAEDD
jgi:hypothetical protein